MSIRALICDVWSKSRCVADGSTALTVVRPVRAKTCGAERASGLEIAVLGHVLCPLPAACAEMKHLPTLNRRLLLGAGIAAPVLIHGSAEAATKPASARVAATVVSSEDFGIVSAGGRDQTAALQAAVDQATAKGLPLFLAPGRYAIGGLRLRPGSVLVGAGEASVLSYNGSGACVFAENAANIVIKDLRIEGNAIALDRGRADALLHLTGCSRVRLHGLRIAGAGGNGIHLRRCSGRVSDCTFEGARDAGLWSEDADIASGGLVVAGSTVADCRDNGILIWRSVKGEDGTRISDCTISRIGNRSGGSGQYGNGVNVFRAGGVSVSNCHISDCAYSAIRGNAASNIQMLGNQARRSGEVALYAEFGFEGAMIANNVVDGAAAGIAVTNFDEGGRLAVVQGNLVRNLARREQEPVDKRGEGITVEADAVVSNNVIEGAPTAGIMIGWGSYMRDVVATGNLVRASRIGIAVSGDPAAGDCLIANNRICGHTSGAIRMMDHATPIGADLVSGGSVRRVIVTGNVG